MEIARRILKVALDDGGKTAIRLLGREARPRRAYRRRGERADQRAVKMASEIERRRHDDERARAKAEALAARIVSIPAEVRDGIAAGLHPLRAVRQLLGLRQVDVAERAGMGAYGDTKAGSSSAAGGPHAAHGGAAGEGDGRR